MQRLDALAVVGVDQLQEPFVRRVERLRLVAVDAEQLVGPPVGVGGDVPVVVAHVGQVLGVVHARGQVGEALLGDRSPDGRVDVRQGEVEGGRGLGVGVGPREQQQADVAGKLLYGDAADALRRASCRARSSWSAREPAPVTPDEVLDGQRGAVLCQHPVCGSAALTTSTASAPAISRSIGRAAAATRPGSLVAASTSARPDSCPVWAVVSMRPLSGGVACVCGLYVCGSWGAMRKPDSVSGPRSGNPDRVVAGRMVGARRWLSDATVSPDLRGGNGRGRSPAAGCAACRSRHDVRPAV